MKYEIMKEQLEKVFTSFSIKKRSREEAVKLKQSDSLYAKDFAIRKYSENILHGKLAVKNTPRNSKNSYQKRNKNILRNSSESNGTVSRCRMCD